MENHFKAIDCLVRLHELINQEQTGPPNELAHELGISRGQLYKMIATLCDFGADVQYSRTHRSFSYGNRFEIPIIQVFLHSNIKN